MPKKKGGRFQVSVESPGAVPGYKRGDRITDPTEDLIELARKSPLLKLIEVGGPAKTSDSLDQGSAPGPGDTEEGRGEA